MIRDTLREVLASDNRVWVKIIAAVIMLALGAVGGRCIKPDLTPAPPVVNVNFPPPAAEARPVLVGAAVPNRIHLGQRIVAEHFRRLASAQAQKDGFAMIDGNKTPLTAEEANKLAARISDLTIAEGAKSFGAPDQVAGDGPGPVLGFIQRVLKWIVDHPEQVQAILKFILSLMMLFGDPVAIRFEQCPDGAICVTAIYPNFTTVYWV
ncbi:MAG: hypothetical protein C0467_31175 [Planctomycetaceae bacterium]|nr:hypothetical protein [Planctomycetaceae bacterium]